MARRAGCVQVLHTGLAKERSPLEQFLQCLLTDAVGLTLAEMREADGLQRFAFDSTSHGRLINAQRLGHSVDG